MAFTWKQPPPPPPPPTAVSLAGNVLLRALLPLLLPLPFFLIGANRLASARWIYLPLGLAALVAIALSGPLVESDLILPRLVCAFTSALAAVWLLMPWLSSHYRVLMFVKTLPVLIAISMLGVVLSLLVPPCDWSNFWPFFVSALTLASLAAALAFTLTGFSVRRRYGRFRCFLWLAIWLVLCLSLMLTPIFVLFALPNGLECWRLFVGILLTSGMLLAVLLPFLLLSFFQPFYRARFAAWLNLRHAEPPVEAGFPPRTAEIAEIPQK